MKLDEITRRLEVVLLRLEKALAEAPPTNAAPGLEAGQASPAGEGSEPSPQVSEADMKAAQEYIEAAQWRAEETLRRWEANGGPSEEDEQAYFDSWTNFRGP